MLLKSDWWLKDHVSENQGRKKSHSHSGTRERIEKERERERLKGERSDTGRDR